jgi:hypothetical protein
MKAASRNWRESPEDGIGAGWPWSEMWMEHKRQEWAQDQLAWELVDMLKHVKGFDCRLVESMQDAVSVSNGNLTLLVVVARPRSRPRAIKRKHGPFNSNSCPRTIPEREIG